MKILNKVKLGLAGLVLAGGLNSCADKEMQGNIKQTKQFQQSQNYQFNTQSKSRPNNQKDSSLEIFTQQLMEELCQNESINNLQTEIKYNERGYISGIILKADKNNNGIIDYTNQSIWEYDTINKRVKITFLTDKNGDEFTDESKFKEYEY